MSTLDCDYAKAATLARAYRQLYERRGGADLLSLARHWEAKARRLERARAAARERTEEGAG